MHTKALITSVAIPREHGGWGMILEAGLLGILLAPSTSALFISFFAITAFLLYSPLKIWIQDKGAGTVYPRTVWAKRFSLFYGLLSISSLIAAFVTNAHPFWVPLALAFALSIARIPSLLKKEDKDLGSQFLAATAAGSVSPSILIAGGWAFIPSFYVWGLLGARAISSIVYIRQRLRKARHQDYSVPQVMMVHCAGLLILGGSAAAASIPWLAVLGFIILILRMIHGMFFADTATRPQEIGFQEILFGLIYIGFAAAGYLLHY